MRLFLFFILTTSTWASSLSLIGPCFETPAFEADFPVQEGESVGSYTIRFLDHYAIDYAGDEQAMSSILKTPIGRDAMEIINDDPSNMEINAYGWCYSVNDVAPEVYPSDVQIKEGDKVKWWFGYARYLNGEWITQCSPSYLRQPDFLCKI